ncbi:tRNA (adenine(58)-N(1))-methyltransferase, mitochondrial [Discoglossus pictus]
MWALCAGRVSWLSRSSPHGCLRLAIRCTCESQVQPFVSWADDPQDGTTLNNSNNGSYNERTTDADDQLSHEGPAPQLIKRRRAWGRSLSPLDRVSQMIPSEFVSQDIKDLRGTDEDHTSLLPFSDVSDPLLDHQSNPQEDCSSSPTPPFQGTPFKPGDLVISDFKRRHYSEFKKLFLLKDSGKLQSNWGSINFSEILEKLPGQNLRTSQGFKFLLKRPSLEEFVLLMKRGPTISYPKDITAMLTMMDITPGDVVLEAGSGSGGMSLFLSRAVGPEGRVYSFEVREDHHAVAKKNFSRWKNAWDVWSKEPWPDNVHFINKDISLGLSHIKTVSFDAVALDMLNPQVALPSVLPNLKQGAVCAAYIANITQVIDLLEGIRSCQLPVVCEKISEVSIKDWLVAPSVRKDGSISQRVEPQWNSEPQLPNLEQSDDEESHVRAEDIPEVKQFGQVPYIARPMPWQAGHTAFLVQLRKYKPAPDHTEPEDPS